MTPTLVDTHCHLTHGRLRAILAQVLESARSAGVRAMISCASDAADSAAAAAIAGQHDEVCFTAGIHPHAAKDASADGLSRIESLAGQAKCVAIGEIGLDYHYDFSPRDLQRQWLARQLELAIRLDKPVVIHTREAFDDTLAVLKESGIDGRRVVFHSFTEPADLARRALEMGAMISFSGIVTFKGSGLLQDSALIVPDDRLLVETDSPYLSPEPVRKIKTNQPAHVAHVANCLARIRGRSPDEIARVTTANAERFFCLEDQIGRKEKS